jgi:glutaredoxin
MPEPEHQPAADPRDRARAAFGTAALLLAAAIPLLDVIERATDARLPMPASWFHSRPIWYGLMLVGFVAGWRLLRSTGAGERDRRPRRGEGSVSQVRLYTRAGCHLCDDARILLDRYADKLPPIEEIDIDADPALREEFDECVPVVEIDGKVRFRGRINEFALRRFIRGSGDL